MGKLLVDPTYRAIIAVTLIVTALVTLLLSYQLALYVLGIGVLVLMAVTENRKEPWSKKLLPVFLAVFGAVIMLNQLY